MKKTIEIPIQNESHALMAERRAEAIAKAIAKRLQIQAPDTVEVDETSAKVDISLTVTQVKKLPVGLRRFVE